MAGIRPNQRTGNDSAYFAVVVISLIAQILVPIVIVAYVWLIYTADRTR